MQIKLEEKEDEESFTLENIATLVNTIAEKTGSAINEIDNINEETHVLAINALIEANRAGETGRTFAVVAQHMSDLSKKVSLATEKMRNETEATIIRLHDIVKMQSTQIRGNRLSDLALMNIDLIDRNLYERSCDIRWWAKDMSVVNALTKKDDSSIEYCSNRLSFILDAYTVYFDLLVCDLDGNVLANGRPHQYNFVGSNYADSTWFKQAKLAKNGTEFGFQTVHRNNVINKFTLIYSCLVHEEGCIDKKPIGVFASIFRWEDLAQKIVKNVPLMDDEKKSSRVCIVDNDGLILADSDDRIMEERIDLQGMSELLRKKGFVMADYEGKKCCIAHALSVGYETYATGWHSVIIQNVST